MDHEILAWWDHKEMICAAEEQTQNCTILSESWLIFFDISEFRFNEIFCTKSDLKNMLAKCFPFNLICRLIYNHSKFLQARMFGAINVIWFLGIGFETVLWGHKSKQREVLNVKTFWKIQQGFVCPWNVL